MTDLTFPTVHLNGTSHKELLDGYCTAIDALYEAGKKLAAVYPNGRDYYPQGPHVTNDAMDQHEARMNKLREIVEELEAIAINISDQGR